MLLSLKSPFNSDQPKLVAENSKLYSMELLLLMERVLRSLPYNPLRRREDYDWRFARWFNMEEDEVAVIGDEFWEKISGLVLINHYLLCC